MVASNELLYAPGEHPDHVVVIKYVPFVGDSKRAMDEYTSEIFMVRCVGSRCPHPYIALTPQKTRPVARPLTSSNPCELYHHPDTNVERRCEKALVRRRRDRSGWLSGSLATSTIAGSSVYSG